MAHRSLAAIPQMCNGPGGADNRPRTAVRSSASAASSTATESETVVSGSGPKASTPWPPSRTARVSGRALISSMQAATGAERGHRDLLRLAQAGQRFVPDRQRSAC